MFPIARFRFVFEALDAVHLPTYPGSAFRGIFGHSLKRSACVTRQPSCESCALRKQCVYTQIFESHLFLEQSGDAPRPLVMDVSGLKQRYEKGESFSIALTMVGVSVTQLPYVIQAWQRAGDMAREVSVQI